jgi:hypothetical protein
VILNTNMDEEIRDVAEAVNDFCGDNFGGFPKL